MAHVVWFGVAAVIMTNNKNAFLAYLREGVAFAKSNGRCSGCAYAKTVEAPPLLFGETQHIAPSSSAGLAIPGQVGDIWAPSNIILCCYVHNRLIDDPWNHMKERYTQGAPTELDNAWLQERLRVLRSWDESMPMRVQDDLGIGYSREMWQVLRRLDGSDIEMLARACSAAYSASEDLWMGATQKLHPDGVSELSDEQYLTLICLLRSAVLFRCLKRASHVVQNRMTQAAKEKWSLSQYWNKVADEFQFLHENLRTLLVASMSIDMIHGMPRIRRQGPASIGATLGYEASVKWGSHLAKITCSSVETIIHPHTSRTGVEVAAHLMSGAGFHRRVMEAACKISRIMDGGIKSEPDYSEWALELRCCLDETLGVVVRELRSLAN